MDKFITINGGEFNIASVSKMGKEKFVDHYKNFSCWGVGKTEKFISDAFDEIVKNLPENGNATTVQKTAPKNKGKGSINSGTSTPKQ